LHLAVGMPVMTKNNRNLLCLDLLNSLFPKAFFIVVSRNTDDVVRSTLKASEDYFNGKHLWALKPDPGFEHTAFENLTEAARHQVHAIQKQIEKQLAQWKPERYYCVTYESFCEKPGFHIAQIALHLKACFELESFEPVCPLQSLDMARRK